MKRNEKQKSSLVDCFEKKFLFCALPKVSQVERLEFDKMLKEIEKRGLAHEILHGTVINWLQTGKEGASPEKAWNYVNLDF